MKPDVVGSLPVFAILLCVLFPAPVGSAGVDDEVDLRLYLQGRYVFERNCVACHGQTGRGNGVLAVGVKDAPRNLRSGVFKFRSTPMGFLPTDEDLARTIRGGIAGTMMPVFESTLSKDDLRAVIAYVKSLSPRWRKEEFHAEALEISAPPVWMASSTERAARLKEAGVLFQATCAVCHGPEGKGDGAGGRELKDMWEHPLEPADLTASHHKSGDKVTDLYRTIALGLDGTPMVGFLEILGSEKVWALAVYVKSLSEKAEGENPGT